MARGDSAPPCEVPQDQPPVPSGATSHSCLVGVASLTTPTQDIISCSTLMIKTTNCGTQMGSLYMMNLWWKATKSVTATPGPWWWWCSSWCRLTPRPRHVVWCHGTQDDLSWGTGVTTTATFITMVTTNIFTTITKYIPIIYIY